MLFTRVKSAYTGVMTREWNIPMGVFLSKKLQATFSRQYGHVAQLPGGSHKNSPVRQLWLRITSQQPPCVKLLKLTGSYQIPAWHAHQLCFCSGWSKGLQPTGQEELADPIIQSRHQLAKANVTRTLHSPLSDSQFLSPYQGLAILWYSPPSAVSKRKVNKLFTQDLVSGHPCAATYKHALSPKKKVTFVFDCSFGPATKNGDLSAVPLEHGRCKQCASRGTRSVVDCRKGFPSQFGRDAAPHAPIAILLKNKRH